MRDQLLPQAAQSTVAIMSTTAAAATNLGQKQTTLQIGSATGKLIERENRL